LPSAVPISFKPRHLLPLIWCDIIHGVSNVWCDVIHGVNNVW
jgi:hypothetical protein